MIYTRETDVEIWNEIMSWKYDSKFTTTLAEFRPGIFTLFASRFEPLIVTDDWDQILPAYRSRPVYIPRAPTAATRIPSIPGLTFNI